MSSEGSLEHALRQFDRAESTLSRLEAAWKTIEAQMPTEVQFGCANDETDAAFEAFDRLAAGLPAINGFSVTARPIDFDEIAETLLGYFEIGEPVSAIRFERDATEPGRQVASYRRRLRSARAQVVRDHVEEQMDQIDGLLASVNVLDNAGSWSAEDRWDELRDAVSLVGRALGSLVPGLARWGDLSRHLRFGQPVDLADIVRVDWPSVRVEVAAALYDEEDPVPVSVGDLGTLARSSPSGRVGTEVDWPTLTAAQFEGLVFEIIRGADGYENANWLMRTNAADRGRDIEVHRVVRDSLSATQRQRVVVQCKHWLGKSVSRADLIECEGSLVLWEPPSVDVVIVATSGRFTQDAVALAEAWNQERGRRRVELWADNHLELLLARRPDVRARFGLA